MGRINLTRVSETIVDGFQRFAHPYPRYWKEAVLKEIKGINPPYTGNQRSYIDLGAANLGVGDSEPMGDSISCMFPVLRELRVLSTKVTNA